MYCRGFWTFGEHQADKFYNKLFDSLELLASFPKTGEWLSKFTRNCDELNLTLTLFFIFSRITAFMFCAYSSKAKLYSQCYRHIARPTGCHSACKRCGKPKFQLELVFCGIFDRNLRLCSDVQSLSYVLHINTELAEAWEGRFKSQALLDEAAIVSCMMYVDLNPVRAGITDTLQDSDFTSTQQRLIEFAERKSGRPKKVARAECPGLLRCAKTQNQEPAKAECTINNLKVLASIPFAFDEYCELIDWTGRAIRNDKRGHIQPLLQRLGIKPGMRTVKSM